MGRSSVSGSRSASANSGYGFLMEEQVISVDSNKRVVFRLQQQEEKSIVFGFSLASRHPMNASAQ
jgi:hypothetical protein